MDTLYDDLLRNQIMPNAFSDWTAYRDELTGFILRCADSGASALIVGAGECNDVDLVRMKGHFRKVTLLDHNRQAMETGLARQGVPWAGDEILCADLVGVAPDVYRRISDRMLALLREELRSGAPDARRFEQTFLRQMASAFRDRQPDGLMEQSDLADYVICCGVHSQLATVFPQMAAVYRRYIPIDWGPIVEAVRKQIPPIVSDLNDALFRWARKGVILGLEECRIGMEGGIDGAWQAMQDLEERGLVPCARTRLTWPFDPSQNKAYSMGVMMIGR